MCSFGHRKLQCVYGVVQGVLRREDDPRPVANASSVRNRHLHEALSTFAEEAAWQLADERSAGAEIPFEVIDAGAGGRGTPLYCYRPLTAGFIDQRAGLIGQLPSYLPAVHALGSAGDLMPYLERRGLDEVPPAGHARAQAALRAFVTRVFEDSSDFVLDRARLGQALIELEEALQEAPGGTEVLVALHGLVIESAQVALGDGLTLLRADACQDAPAEALRIVTAGRSPGVLAVLRWEQPTGDEEPLRHARVRLRRLLTALRLYDPAQVAFGAAAWTRTSAGPWHAVVLGVGAGRPLGECQVAADQEDELRAFCSLVTRRTPKGGEIAWALHRLDLGCERAAPMDVLTDHLLALRALLEPEGPQSARLPGRVAALCAHPDGRIETAERVSRAVRLEQAHIAGRGSGEPDPPALVAEMSAHLRAILRDVLCGHLDPDVRRVADEILAAPITAPVDEDLPTLA